MKTNKEEITYDTLYNVDGMINDLHIRHNEDNIDWVITIGSHKADSLEQLATMPLSSVELQDLEKYTLNVKNKKESSDVKLTKIAILTSLTGLIGVSTLIGVFIYTGEKLNDELSGLAMLFYGAMVLGPFIFPGSIASRYRELSNFGPGNYYDAVKALEYLHPSGITKKR